jgi:hypothetical protein
LDTLNESQGSPEQSEAVQGSGADTSGPLDKPPEPQKNEGEKETRGRKKKAESADSAGSAPIGTIRIQNGVEEVKVEADKWVPVIRREASSGDPVTVVSDKRAGKTIFAKTGRPITFDEKGRATVSAEDGLYLENLPGFVLE